MAKADISFVEILSYLLIVILFTRLAKYGDDWLGLLRVYLLITTPYVFITFLFLWRTLYFDENTNMLIMRKAGRYFPSMTQDLTAIENVSIYLVKPLNWYILIMKDSDGKECQRIGFSKKSNASEILEFIHSALQKSGKNFDLSLPTEAITFNELKDITGYKS